MPILVIVVGGLLSGFYFARKSGTNAEAYSNDFNVYYRAAREVISGRDPYQQSLGEWTPYIYPPLLAEVMTPFALLPLPLAAYCWFLVSGASMVGAAWMSAGLATETRERESRTPGQDVSESTLWRASVAAVASVVVLRFILDTFNLGQVNAVVTGLAVAHVWLYARGKKALSAVALVIAVSIKLTPAFLLLYHIAKLRVRFAIVCAGLLVAVTALSFLPFGSGGADAFQTFWGRTVNNKQGYDFRYSGNQSLRGAVARLIGDDPANEVVDRRPADLATTLISIVMLALALLGAVRTQNEVAAAAPFFCCMVMLSPLSWKAHYVILIFPVAHLVSRMKTSSGARYLIGATLAIGFALFNFTSPRIIGFAAAEWADDHSLVLAGALLIFGASLAIALTSRFGKRPRVC